MVKKTGIPAAVRRAMILILPPKPADEVFTRIYKKNYWGAESLSGVGSTLDQTARWRAEVPPLLARLGVGSMLDAPCGDFFWMREAAGLPPNYIGADIVAEMIAENTARYGAPGRTFRVLNIIEDPIPKVDLIHCRDCLVHLPLSAAQRAIDNFRKSGSTYLLTTTFPGTGRRNIDIAVGHWRPLDLTLPPFNFPAPEWSLAEMPDAAEDGITHHKHLALWKLADLPA